ncbi:M23 family metallopeptidase [Nostoc sp. 'Peltigera membranacea cyanobiont' 232]|uniref:M23 family metallopeptidase n=1 Tax=Nostoc sp. 'Peltigera membranacea cyanobiont' 232 TaxID=2014531 RepID=UPI000B952ED1|nr:M23 family metallopeptidase [Nostoc sp. 'Peltigera membranacea cyanobiont' 232]OYE00242.1 hypothetical protein CDG79_36245 [Nostoc sp. 'Peltigera membranacea cyanobiont' 232]
MANAQLTNRRVQGFPWATGQTWKYSQDLHGSINNGLDFGTPNGVAGDVYSVDSGTVYRVTDNCTIIIKRADGLYHGYHHVKPDSTITEGKQVSYQTKLGTTALCGGSNAHHVHFWLYDQNTVNKQKSFSPIGFYFGNWQLTQEQDSSEPPGSGNYPVSGYDYVLKNGTTIACAGTTMQYGKNICTTNQLTNQITFVSPSSKLTVTALNLDLTISATNLSGKTVYVQTWRPAVNGYPAKYFPAPPLTATGNTVTFYNLDGDGSTLAGVTYYTVVSLEPIITNEAEKQRISCFDATGGKYLCDAARR